jgi:hypothetical protein
VNRTNPAHLCSVPQKSSPTLRSFCPPRLTARTGDCCCPCAGTAALASAESYDSTLVPAFVSAHRGLQARDANICSTQLPAVLTDQTGTLSDDQTGPDHAVDCTAGGCSGLDTGSNGYGDNLDCTKTISAPIGSTIALTIVQIALESGSACATINNGVGCDVLTVYDGPSTYAPVLGVFSGNDIPRPVQSTRNSMTVRFTTDGMTHALPTQPCGLSGGL